LQSRNAALISAAKGRAIGPNHAIVTPCDVWPISEFLIVGCQHGWLKLFGYYDELAAIRAVS
jgi:hypothetical protein